MKTNAWMAWMVVLKYLCQFLSGSSQDNGWEIQQKTWGRLGRRLQSLIIKSGDKRSISPGSAFFWLKWDGFVVEQQEVGRPINSSKLDNISPR